MRLKQIHHGAEHSGDRPRYRFVKRRWHWLCAAIDFVGAHLLALSKGRSRAKAVTGVGPTRILVIQLDHLGDAVITLPMLAALRQRFRASRIDVLCGPNSAELFRMSPAVDAVRVLRFNRFARDWRAKLFCWLPALLVAAWRIRRAGYDLAFDVRGELPHALLMWLAGITRRIGWTAGGGGFLLTDSPLYIAGRPEHESRGALLRMVGIHEDATSALRLLKPRAEARGRLQNRLLQLDGSRPLVVLHVGAGADAKRWPATHWRGLIEQLHRETAANLVLVGSGVDRPGADSIVETADVDNGRLFDWVGCLSLPELTALLERGDLFVGADSGPAHLAAGVGCRTLVLFSGTNLSRQWRPAGDHVVVLEKPVPCAPCFRPSCPVPGHPCLADLAVEQVLGAALIALEPNNERFSDDMAETSRELVGACR